MIVTGRLIDPATGRPVRAKHVSYVKLPTNRNEGDAAAEVIAAWPTRPSGSPSRPARGCSMPTSRGKDLPYTRARLRKADKGKGVGGIGDGET